MLHSSTFRFSRTTSTLHAIAVLQQNTRLSTQFHRQRHCKRKFIKKTINHRKIFDMPFAQLRDAFPLKNPAFVISSSFLYFCQLDCCQIPNSKYDVILTVHRR
jgi:hypothetical protein